MKVVYVMEQTSLAGGHKDIFEQANRLADRGHEVEIASVYPDASSWFPLRVPNRVCRTYPGLTSYLSGVDALKVATWWKTARPVATAGGGAYFVQDVEVSYASTPEESAQVMQTYRSGLDMFTESVWVADEMERLGLERPAYVGIGVDGGVFYPAELSAPANNWVLFHERDHFLKGPQLRAQVLQSLAAHRDITTIGYSPWMPNRYAHKHLRNPKDAELADVMRRSLCLLVTSAHEGFCMPAMEAMACGLPVVTTDAQGNWFCKDGYNCLMAQSAAELTDHVLSLRQDHGLWRGLREGGLETVAEHFQWEQVIRRLELLFEDCFGLV